MTQIILIIFVGLYMSILLVAYLKERKSRPKGDRDDKNRHKHEGGMQIDSYAYQSQLKNVNAGVKVSFSVSILVLCIILNRPLVSLAILSVTAYLTMIRGGLSFHKYFRVLLIPITFIILGTVTIAIEISQSPLLDYSMSLGFFYVNTSKANLLEMLVLMLKLFAAVSALQMMILTTPSSEIISVMRKARVPKLIIELMNLIYRYIFILLDVYGKMRNSAESRLGYVDLKTAYLTFAGIGGNLLVVSMKKATAYYNAMEARCYDGDLVFLEEDKKIVPAHLFAGVVFIMGIIALWAISK